MNSIRSIASVLVSTASRVPEVFEALSPDIPKRPLPQIDMTKDIIVIWVPGTSTHDIHPRFQYYANLYWGSRAELVLCDYLASWNFSRSIPDGFRTLKSIVDYVIKHRRKGQRIVLAGESQGALLIGELMARPEYYKAIDKAALLGHPGISEKHYRPGDKKVLEINNTLDPATLEWPIDGVDALKSIDRLFTDKDLRTIPFFLRTIISAPLFALDLATTQAVKLPFLRDKIPHPHNYTSRMQEAILWLNYSG